MAAATLTSIAATRVGRTMGAPRALFCHHGGSAARRQSIHPFAVRVRIKVPVYHAPGLEPTLSELQAQIDRLSLTVHQGREQQGQLAATAHQLALAVQGFERA